MANQNKSIKAVPRKRKPKKKHRVLLTILVIFLAIALLGCLLVGGYVLALSKELPDITVEDLINAQTSFVYDSTGELIATLHGGENRISVALSEMPDYLIDAVIASEDIRFFEHKGVDWRSVMRALVVDVKDTIAAGEVAFTQGASTITMQLIRSVLDQTEKTLPRKIKEALLALEFEKMYDKDEILYYYLNEIYIGPQIYGMQAASEYYFGKDVGDISLEEAALLVAVLRNPGYYSPYDNPDRVLPVRNAVLNNMIIYNEELYGVTAKTAQAAPIVVYDGEEDSAKYDYPWFVDYVISEAMDIMVDMGMEGGTVFTGGLHIHTTLDTHVQRVMEEEYANDENFPSSSTGDIVESAMAIVEPFSGEIKGLVGGRVYAARRGFNRATDLQRSPGSTIKPLVSYGPAIELGYGAGHIIDDAPISFGSWSPNNDDHAFLGRITMRQAVMQSRNICAVKMLQQIGVETGWEFGRKMGLPLVEEDMGLALCLGGLTYGVSPLEMAGAFATFASEGVYTEPYTIKKIVNSKDEVVYSVVPALTEVFAPASAYIMTDILMSAVNGGTGTSAKISGWQTAGKTGTNGLPTEDPDYNGKSGTKDAWFCGYTPALAAAVWIGYDNKKDENGNLQYLSNVYGGSYPARLFNKVMTRALETYENTNFSRPDGVTSMTVDLKTGTSPTELTPSSYVGSDIFRVGSGLVGDGTTWQMVEICLDTNMLAGTYCPNKESRVMLTYPEGKRPSERVGDYALYMPASTCSTHSTHQSGMVGVYICTHPSHSGVAKLANIAASGSSGGCPDEYVSIRYYANPPTGHCGIDSHQVEGDQASSHEDGGDSGGWPWDEWFGGGDDDPSTDTSTPNAPSHLNASQNDDGIYVSWRGNNENSNVVYVLERTNTATKASERIVVSGTEYQDGNVVRGNTYSYRVYAYNSVNENYSGWSSASTASY